MDERAALPASIFLITALSLISDIELALATILPVILLVLISSTPLKRILKVLFLALPMVIISTISIWLFSDATKAFTHLLRVSVAVVCLSTIYPQEDIWGLVNALKHYRLPTPLLTLHLFIHRYFQDMWRELKNTKVGLRARGYRRARNLLDRKGLSVLGNLTGALLHKRYRRAVEVEMGLEARGFRGAIIEEGEIRMGMKEILYTTTAIFWGIALIYLRFFGGELL